MESNAALDLGIAYAGQFVLPFIAERMHPIGDAHLTGQFSSLYPSPPTSKCGNHVQKNSLHSRPLGRRIS